MSKGPKKPKPTEAERWQAIISQRTLDYVRKNYDPVTKRFLTKFQREAPLQEQNARNVAASSTEQAFAPAEQQVEQAQASRGLQTDGGAVKSAVVGFNADLAKAKAKASNEATLGARGNHMSNTASLVASGKGQEAGLIQQAGQLATSMNAKAIADARAAAAAKAGLTNAVGTVGGYALGMGMDKWGPQPPPGQKLGSGLGISGSDPIRPDVDLTGYGSGNGSTGGYT